MERLLFGLLGVLALGFAYAQAAPEAPLDQASILTVVVFLVLFVGTIVGFFAYSRYSNKKASAGEAEEKAQR